MSLPERFQSLRVRTPEGAEFSFRLASPVLRLVALLVDWAVIVTAFSTLMTVIALLKVVSADVAGWLAVVSYFLIAYGYDMACEWRWRGQTLGKRLLRLRVIDARGLRLTLPQIVLRNLLRMIDTLPGPYLVGGLAALLNRRGQRLGDLAAGTLVIWEPAEPAPDFSGWQAGKYNSLRAQTPVVARLRQAIGPVEARAAWQALLRREQLEPAARVQLFATMAEQFRIGAAVPVELTEGVSDEQFVRNVVEVLFLSRG